MCKVFDPPVSTFTEVMGWTSSIYWLVDIPMSFLVGNIRPVVTPKTSVSARFNRAFAFRGSDFIILALFALENLTASAKHLKKKKMFFFLFFFCRRTFSTFFWGNAFLGTRQGILELKVKKIARIYLRGARLVSCFLENQRVLIGLVLVRCFIFKDFLVMIFF